MTGRSTHAGLRWIRVARWCRFLPLIVIGFLQPVAILLSASRVLAIVPAVRQILLVGTGADAGGDTRGTVFIFSLDPAVDPATATAAAGLVNPAAAAITPDGRFYIADAGADPLHLHGALGAVWLVDPAAPTTAPARLVVANPLFRKPADLLLEPDGTILLLDTDADPREWGARNGAIFRIDLATGNVTVLAAPSVFREPRSMTIDPLDGTILVVDEVANPTGLSDPAGAIFRVNPHVNPDSVTVTTERAFKRGDRRKVLSPTAVAVIEQGVHRGDYLLVDRSADPYRRGNAPGAVFRVSRSTGEIELFTATEVVEFSEPVDILLGLDNDVYVLDRFATSEAQAALGKGAVFRFRLDDGVLLQSPKVSNAFRGLNSFIQLAGAQLDSSRVTWTDETPGLTEPGDFFTARVRVRNTGTTDAPVVSLEDTLRASFLFVPGSDSVGSGRAFFDQGRQRFSWSGPLAQADSTEVRFRFKISDYAPPGVRIEQRLVLRTAATSTTFSRLFTPRREFGIGAGVFLDVDPASSAAGVIYAMGADSTDSSPLRRDALLVRPADSVFLEDGRLAILDPQSPAGQLGAILVYSFNSADTLSVLLALRRELGFVRPAGLALDRDGTLLVVDLDANPQGYPYTPADPFNPDPGPGAIFRYNAVTKVLSLAAANPGFHQPLDAVVDRRGALVVVDYGGGTDRQGALWELFPGATAREIELDADLFQGPTGVTVDEANDLYVCSFRARAGPNPKGGAIYKLHRGQELTVSIASADTLLREPLDLTVSQQDGRLLVADRAANPLNLPELPGDHRGAVFKLDPSTGALTVAAASGLLRNPDGVAFLGWPELRSSQLSFRTSVPGDPRPGDTLWVEVQVVNTGLRSAPHSLAVLSFSSSTLRVLPVDRPAAGLVVDTLGNRAVWTGRVAWGDTMRLSVPSVVLPDGSFGAMAEVKLSVQGGRYPCTADLSCPIRADFLPNDLVLIDGAADPRGLGGPYGAVFRLGQEPLQGRRLVVSQTNLKGVTAAEWTSRGDLLLAADCGDTSGAVYRFETLLGRLTQHVRPDERLKTPVDLLFAPAGDLLIVDRDAQEQGPAAPSRGAIFSRTATGLLSVYCADSLFRAPTQAAFGPDGMLYLADPAANPEGRSGNSGAVFTIDPGTREVVGWLQDPTLPEPTGVTAYDDSTLLISDSLGAYPSIPRGTLKLYRPQGRVPLESLVTLPEVKSLWRSIRMPSGEVLLLDRLGKHTGEQTGVGLVRGFDPSSHRLREFAWSDSFVQISDLVVKPGPVVRFARYEWSDANGPPLHPADRLRGRAVLRNIGVVEASGVAYRDSLPAEAAIIPGTAESVDGQGVRVGLISEDSRALDWSGSVAPGDSVVISYDVQLNPVSEGRLLLFHPTVSSHLGGTLDKTVKLQAYVPLQEGYAYLVDPEADPFRESGTGQLGALFKVNLTTGAVIPMLTSLSLRRPISVALVGNPVAPRFLILDTAARNQYGRAGTLFLFDPLTRDLRNLGGHPEFKTPVKVLAWTETTALVLDAKADPDTLYSDSRSGPGAIFEVNLETAEFRPVFSDTTLKVPASIAWLEPGILAISDEKADPNGPDSTGTGAIYRLDLARQELRLFATSHAWRTPGPISSDLHGGLLLVDRDATPYDASGGYGSVFKVNAQGSVVKTALSRFFVMLRDVQAELDGDPLVTDGNTDPYGLGGAPGAVLRWMMGHFVPIASSPMFRNPSGLVIYGDPTPVDLLEAAADSTGEGILLRWRAGVDESGAHWLIFRREAAGPEDPGDAAPEGYDPVGGDRDFRGAGPHEYLDRGLEGGRWYVYLVARVAPDGAVDYSTPLLAHASGGVVRLELLPAVPSPFSGRTNFAFLVPAPGGRVRLAVFDVAGRRVRVLHDGPAVAGRHALEWDGRDDAGRRLASGVYFARLSLGDEARSRRLVLMQ